MSDRTASELGMRRAMAGVVPCYNAGAQVRKVAEAMLGQLDRVTVVDDGSTDGGTDALRALRVRTITFERNRGKGHALLAGFRAALEDAEVNAVCVLDADGQHDPADIPRFFEALTAEQADLVIGARVFDKGNVPWRSWFGNTITVTITAWLVGQRLPDTQCGFRLLSRRFAEAVLDTVAGGRYETEMEIVVKAVREGYRIVSVPIATVYEQGNRSSHFRKFRDSARIYARLLRTALRRRAV